jgi:hypothetical protein
MEDVSKSGDRPAATDEIEITPAMIEAGVEIIYGELSGAPELPAFFSAELFARKVFEAMVLASPRAADLKRTA